MRSHSVVRATGSAPSAVDEDRIHGLIRRAGGRLTVPTRLLVSILAGTDRHLTADDLIAEIERRRPGIAPSTVYRVLQRLHQLQIVGNVCSGVGPAYYHLRQHGHAHLVCTECRSIIDVPDTAFAQISRASRRSHDFTVDPHHSAILGRCARCSS